MNVQSLKIETLTNKDNFLLPLDQMDWIRIPAGNISLNS